MKIKREDLMAVLLAVRPGLAKKDIVEQATHFIFTGKDVVTYNDHICISHPLETAFKGSVEADKFYKILSGIKDERISLKADGNKLMVDSSKTRSALSMIPAGKINEYIDKLSLRTVTKSLKQNRVPSDFIGGLFLCMFSASRDLTHGPLAGVFVSGKNIYSSDDLRISRYEMKVKISEKMLLPAQSVMELVKFPVIYFFLAPKSGWAHFGTKNGVVFSCRLMKDDYPDPSKFFATEGRKVTLPKETQAAVKAVSIMTEGIVDADRRVELRVGDGKLTLRGEQEIGWVERDVELKYKGKSFKTQINPTFLFQVLDKSTTVTIGENKALFESGTFQHVMKLPK